MMSKPKIMVVEDEGIVALSIRRSLERMGYKVIATVPTGEEAVLKAETEHLDLVLMDIRLKGDMLGTEAASEIKKRVDVPVIYLTAYSDEETLRKAKVAEPFGYLVKPYSDRELHAAVEMAIHNSALERERKLAEEAVRTRDRLLQDLMDNSPNVIALRDLEGRFLHVNLAFEKTFGASRRAVLGTSPPETVPAFGAKALDEVDRRILETGDPQQAETEYATRDGPRTMVVSKFALRNPRGAIYGIGAIATDFTERKRAADALAASERRYRLLADNSTDVISLSSPDGTLHYVSPSAARLIGYQAEELVGKDGNSFFHPGDVGRVLETARRSGGQPLAILFRVRHRDGHYLWVESAVRAVMDPDTAEGEVLLSVTRDVTDRVKAEQEVRRLNEDLEQRVALRTEQLAAANRELEAFTYTVSHDLRAPLRGIRAYVEMLDEVCDETTHPEARPHLDKVREQAGRLAGLIDNLLRLSLASQKELSLAPVDVTAMAKEVVDEIRARVPSSLARVETEEGMVAIADEVLLRQVLVNLLGNAWKYSSQAEDPRIDIGTTETPRGAAFFVRDNGVGFDPSEAGRLFQPFRRLETARSFEGTGIGLATVARIIHRHGGEAWAEGEVGRGATFYFTLPPAGAAPPDGRASRGATPSSARAGSP